LKTVTNGVFVAQFVNTGILIILPNANLQEIGIPITSMMGGIFYDFAPKWYTVVGFKLT